MTEASSLEIIHLNTSLSVKKYKTECLNYSVSFYVIILAKCHN